MRDAVHPTGSVVITTVCPALSFTGRPPATFPVRIFGPCRSARIATGFWWCADARRIHSARSLCSPGEPCEKLSRATSIPARTSRSIISAEETAGPMVQTIFARRNSMVVESYCVTAKWLTMRYRNSTPL